MRFTARTIYALRAVIELARHWNGGNGLATLGTLSETCEIPLKFLVAVLAGLRRADLVESVRGKDGGYRLSRSPVTVRLGDVVRATESPKTPATKRGKPDQPIKNELLFFENLRLKAELSAFSILDGVSVQDAIDILTTGGGEMYYI